jgi:hypothetical protein
VLREGAEKGAVKEVVTGLNGADLLPVVSEWEVHRFSEEDQQVKHLGSA